MKYVEAPHPLVKSDTLSCFLAGGITGCPDWQQQVREMLKFVDVALVNPRRANFPINVPEEANVQIAWEHMHLRACDFISFWFAAEQIQPIVLYELGAWSMTKKPLIVGVHPDYPRKADVMIQTKLARPDVMIVQSLESLCGGIQEMVSRLKAQQN